MINSKYFRVPKKKEPLQEHEIYLTSKQDPINFLKYAIFLFEKRNLPYVKFKASGSAIAGLVNIAEILKKVVPGVHQVNKIYTLKYEQDYEPKEKGLDHVTIVRNVPILEIAFYKELLDLNMTELPGFQKALRPETFERVQINFNNVIRKRNKVLGIERINKNSNYNNFDNNNNNYNSNFINNNYKNNNVKRSYKVGFRGGKTFRGGLRTMNNKLINVERGLKPGFRGGRGNLMMKENRDNNENNKNYNNNNNNNNNNSYSNNSEIRFKVGFRGGFRGKFRGNRGDNTSYNSNRYNKNENESEDLKTKDIKGFTKYNFKYEYN